MKQLSLILISMFLLMSCSTQRNMIAVKKLESARTNIHAYNTCIDNINNEHGLDKTSRKEIRRNINLAKKQLNIAIRKVRMSRFIMNKKEAKFISKILIKSLSTSRNNFKKVKKYKVRSIKLY